MAKGQKIELKGEVDLEIKIGTGKPVKIQLSFGEPNKEE
jgi:hypothetical protein